jgi:hypothetical protein
MAEKEKMKLNFKFELRRVKKDKIGPAICKDFKKDEYFSSCAWSDKCKNATYLFGKRSGICYGGMRASEIEDRRKNLDLVR